MIILITGATHTGKTLLAQKMLEQMHFPYLSIDHLKMGLIRSGQTDLTPLDEEQLTPYLWPIVREIIKTAIENKQNLIVEGCYVPFDWQKGFSEKYLSSIRFICLAMTEKYLDVHFDEIIKNGSVIENRLDDSYCNKADLIRDNRFYIEGCRKHNLPLILIAENYEKSIKELLAGVLRIKRGDD